MKQDKDESTVNSKQALTNRMSVENGSPLTTSFPSLETLTTGLQSIFSGNINYRVPTGVLSREPNIYASNFSSEIVKCRLDDGSVGRLFCKYGAGYFAGSSVLRGVPYESFIYRNVLEQLPLTTAKFYGAFEDQTTGNTCLVLEYLDNHLRVNESSGRDALKLTAHWMGRFHAAGEQLPLSAWASNLNKYNAEYFFEWRRRMSDIPNQFKQKFAWLAELSERCDAFLELLLEAQQTIIHGEFYPNNALIRDGEIRVVDWKTAGIGAGEIDLAALTQGPWPEEILQESEAAYRMARWCKSTPLGFDRTFGAAKLYYYFRLLFHWLKFYPNRANNDLWLFNHMYSTGERLGLI